MHVCDRTVRGLMPDTRCNRFKFHVQENGNRIRETLRKVDGGVVQVRGICVCIAL